MNGAQLGGVLLVCGALFASGYAAGEAELARVKAEHQAELQKLRGDLAEATLSSEVLARDYERLQGQQQARLDQLAKEKDDEARKAIQKRDSAIAAGELRLRERFTCAGASTGGELPSAAANPGGLDAGAQRGFVAADAANALRITDQGDDNTRALNKCIGLLKLDRGVQ